MKPQLHKRRKEAGMTLFEVGVVVAVILLLAAVLLPALRSRQVRTVDCVMNLKQIGLAYRIWEGDNGDIYPMGISVTNGGSMEMVATGNVVQTFLVMSNVLSTTKILVCPNDKTRDFVNDKGLGSLEGFKWLTNSNLSYSVAVDTTNETNPRMLLSGDCNFEIGSKNVKSGLLVVGTNEPTQWSATRHLYAGGRCGNLGLADGSVSSSTSISTSSISLHAYFAQTGFATNRLAIP